MSATKKIKYIGIILNPILFPNSPNSDGIKVEPAYAPAICMPIIAPEFSVPKLKGVE